MSLKPKKTCMDIVKDYEENGRDFAAVAKKWNWTHHGLYELLTIHTELRPSDFCKVYCLSRCRATHPMAVCRKALHDKFDKEISNHA